MGSIIFEDFGTLAETQIAKVPPEDDAKRSREYFDEGYAQGWNDALASEEAEHQKSQTDIAVALQETSFSYVEARMHILKSIQPLLNAIVSSVLPEIAKASLSERISQELFKLTSILESPIEIVCAEQDLEAIEAHVATHARFPVRVTSEESFAQNQVVMRFEKGNAEIDLDETFSSISQLLNDFYESLETKEDANVGHG